VTGESGVGEAPDVGSELGTVDGLADDGASTSPLVHPASNTTAETAPTIIAPALILVIPMRRRYRWQEAHCVSIGQRPSSSRPG
jgi:hypothetical protein